MFTIKRGKSVLYVVECPIPYIVASHLPVRDWKSNVGSLDNVEVTENKITFTVSVETPGMYNVVVSDGKGLPIHSDNLDFSNKSILRFGISYE